MGEFGERRGDPQRVRCVQAQFVVSTAKVLYEGVTGDDVCAVRSVRRPRIGRSRCLSWL